MKILVLSNLYPPYYIGGYEVRCADVVENLRNRGHDITVITSQYGRDQASQVNISNLDPQGPKVFRVLSFRWFTDADLRTLYDLELQDHTHFRQLVKQFRPEVIYIWNCSGLSKALLIHAQSYRLPVVYHFEDDWFLEEYTKDPWLHYSTGQHPLTILRTAFTVSHASAPHASTSPPTSQHAAPQSSGVLRCFPKGLIYRILGRWMSRRLPLGFAEIYFRAACFVSHFRKQQYIDAGLPVQEAVVIHGGIDTQRFPGVCAPRKPEKCLKILCVSQLYKGKGIHTVIDALLSVIQRGFSNVTLTIAGSEENGNVYTDFLYEKLNVSAELKKAVRFIGKVSYEQMPALYQEHDIFISASIIPEGFPLTVVEAMASGLVTFSTGTGGAQEIIQDGKNGVLFSSGDPHSLADQLERVFQNRDLQVHLSQNARQTARTQFDIQTMVTNIETFLEEQRV